MRVNIYSQEITNEVRTVANKSNTGIVYTGIQFMLHSSPLLHYKPGDDDRSAVTFWLPRGFERRMDLATTFEKASKFIRLAPPETGSD